MRILMVLLSFLMFGCSEKTKNVEKTVEVKNKELQYNLRILNMEFFPAFSNPIDVLIDFDEKYMCVYPPQDVYIPTTYLVNSFIVTIEDEDLRKIDDFVKLFDSIDFQKTNNGEAVDGLHLEALFVFSNQTLQKVSPGNMPIKKYEDLSKMILELVLKYNKSESNKKVIDEIKSYQ